MAPPNFLNNETEMVPGENFEEHAVVDGLNRPKRQYSAGDRGDLEIAVKKLTEQDILTQILSNYNPRIRPPGLNSSNPDTGGPVIVSVNLYLRSISKIDDVNMEYSTQFTFREEWYDTRLAYGRLRGNKQSPMPSFVILAHGQHIWMPDTFFQNEKEARKHEIDKPNVLIRIYPDGQILYSVRLSLVLSCPMVLEYYPLDNQTCYIDLASYAYTTEDILYQWKSQDPVQKKDGLEKSLPSFRLQDILTSYYISSTTTGDYICLRTIIRLAREYSFYIIQLYIPSFMLVVVSWVNFWIDKDAVPARVSLGVTTLLTMTTQASGVNAKLPPVSYTKAVDVWIGVCLAFIFGALLEFALVNYAGRVEFLDKERKKQTVNLSTSALPVSQAALGRFQTFANVRARPQQGATTTAFWNPGAGSSPAQVNQRTSHFLPANSGGAPAPSYPQNVPYDQQQQQANESICSQCNVEGETHIPLMLGTHPDFCEQLRVKRSKMSLGIANPLACLRSYLSRYKERSKRIDVISRLIFPLLFFFFNCIYWSFYML